MPSRGWTWEKLTSSTRLCGACASANSVGFFCVYVDNQCANDHRFYCASCREEQAPVIAMSVLVNW